MFVIGGVPGNIGGVVKVSDNIKNITKKYRELPHPTFLESLDSFPDVLVAESPELDPMETMYLHDNAVPEVKDEDDPQEFEMQEEEEEGPEPN